MSERGKQIFERLSRLRYEEASIDGIGAKQKNKIEQQALLNEYGQLTDADAADRDMADRFAKGEYIGTKPNPKAIKKRPG